MTLNLRLAALLESGEFDWDNPYHREAYLKAFAAGQFSAGKPDVPHTPVRMSIG
jgi:hypothetical protein